MGYSRVKYDPSSPFHDRIPAISRFPKHSCVLCTGGLPVN